jgi:hypothetical protein
VSVLIFLVHSVTRMAAEASALQILAVEAFCTDLAEPSGTPVGAWGLLSSWAAGDDGGRLFHLLRRYTSVCPPVARAVLHAERDARAAMLLLATGRAARICLGRPDSWARRQGFSSA